MIHPELDIEWLLMAAPVRVESLTCGATSKAVSFRQYPDDEPALENTAKVIPLNKSVAE